MQRSSRRSLKLCHLTVRPVARSALRVARREGPHVAGGSGSNALLAWAI